MRRIVINSVIAAAVIALFYWLVWLYDTALRDARFFDGWLLFTGMVMQMLFNIRKKLPMLPLGQASIWMQAHIYTGYVMIALFLLHTDLTLPDSAIEWALWSLFVIVALSGVTGIYLTRAIPSRLEHGPSRIVFERIPAFRAELAQQADSLVMNAVNESGLQMLSTLYVDKLHGFFKRPQNLLSHLRHSRRPARRTAAEFDNIERYLDEPSKDTLNSIKDLVEVKHKLDFEYAHQGALKTWLFIHIPATYGMVVVTIAHVAIVYAFSSGAP